MTYPIFFFFYRHSSICKDKLGGKNEAFLKASSAQLAELATRLSTATTMSWNSKDDSFLGSDASYEFPEESVSLKSILSGKKQSMWLFPRRKKRVKFAELEVKNSAMSTKTREKWRKYVAEQFKTLRSGKRKRDRWLGRAGKNKQKSTKFTENISSSASSSTDGPGVAQSNGLEDSFSSQDQLKTFEIPEPGDHLCPKFGLFQSVAKLFSNHLPESGQPCSSQ